MKLHALVDVIDTYLSLDAAQQAEFTGLIEQPAFAGARKVMNSWHEQGRAKGVIEGRLTDAREIVLELGAVKFGKPTKKVKTAVNSIEDVARLHQLAKKILRIDSWAALLAD